MEIFAYDENGDLVMRQGPFTYDFEAVAMFEAERKEMAQNKVFHLSLEKTYLAQNHRARIHMSAVR
jgi:hypothetical protein